MESKKGGRKVNMLTHLVSCFIAGVGIANVIQGYTMGSDGHLEKLMGYVLIGLFCIIQRMGRK